MSVFAYSVFVAVAVLESAVCVRLSWQLKQFSRRDYVSTPSMVGDGPSVSVCIPARNERHAMTRCLESVLASSYPKMEVLVLDDDSVDNTSSLIKTFAREGVRFIEGGDLPEGWLGKNHALQRLLREASGTYVIFLDVDTTLSTTSIAQLVAYAESTRAHMVSALPRRSDLWRASVLLAPLRYFWRVLFHRPSQPVVASGVWMVRRKEMLQDFDGFSSLKLAMEPEVDIARFYLARQQYHFLTSRSLLGISYEKKLSSQIETMIRLRFPAYRYSTLRTIVSSFLKVAVAVLPFAFVIDASYAPWCIVIYALGAAAYYMYLSFVWQRGALVGMLLWPLILIGDAGVSLASMVSYKRGRVTWKGRPIISLR